MLIPVILIWHIQVLLLDVHDNSVPVYDGHDSVGSTSVKSRGWLIQKQDRWRFYKFHTDVDTLAFTSGHSTDKLITNLNRL